MLFYSKDKGLPKQNGHNWAQYILDNLQKKGINTIFADDMKNNSLNASERSWKLRHCRLYNGEANPMYEEIILKPIEAIEPTNGYKKNKTQEEIDSILAVFYWGEKIWVEEDKDHCNSRNEFTVRAFKYDVKKALGIDLAAPKDLKVILYHVFLDWVDGLYNRFCTHYETELFVRYYIDIYMPIPTLNQKRDQERRPRLIEKCRYYHGEQSNPWELCYSPILVYRREIWSIEKEWVDAMACSYNCPQNSKQLIKNFVLEEFFKSKGIALSLVNLILSKEKSIADEKKEYFGPAEAIKVIEKYEKYAPLGHDYKKYFAFFLGEDECPYGYDSCDEYKRMGWSQESLQAEHCRSMCDFDSTDFQKEYRGKEGIWGWYADPKFPREQKDILYFNICNWGRWVPYCDEDKLAEEYLNYHYPGDEKPKHSERFYHNAALQEIVDDEYYKTVRKCGMYQGKRVYQPILKDEYAQEPPPIGLPLVILVDDDGIAESICDMLSFTIYDEISKSKRSTKTKDV